VFRDPPSQEPEAAALRQEIASVLVRAPTLPVDLPAFRMRLVDVRAERRAVDLLVGWERPVAALRISPRKGEGDVVTLGRARPAAADVAVVPLHESAERHRASLDAMASRLRAAITEAQLQRAMELASRLRALPAVPMDFYRQLVPGVDHPEGLVRTGFLCNQDCGICWQDRDWGRFPPEQVLRWIEDLRAAGAQRLIISGGEPTLDASLERYLRRARELGFVEVTLETNAIQCAKPGVAERLRDVGVSLAFVSIHSGDPEVSDRITRAPGTHARTVKGVHALLDAGVPVKFNAVMTGEGLDHLAGLPDFLHAEFSRHGAPLQGLARDRLVGKRTALAAHFLVVLVTLAGDQHHVGRIGVGQRAFDGLGAIDLDDRRPGVAQAGAHGLDDGPRLFVARVVAGQHQAVGPAFGGLRHQRALAGIAVAATAEHAPQMSAALRRQRAQRLQHLLERVGRMGVVHHRQRRARQADALHAAGHGGQVGAGGHRIRQRHAQRPQRAQHAHQVVDVVVTHQRGADGDALGALAHHPLQALVGVADVGGPQACIAPAGHGPGVQSARLGLGHQFAGAWVVGLNHRRP